MNDRMHDSLNNVDERAERLIVRSLDGEATPAEQAELETLMGADPAVAALYRDYRRMDFMASDALHADFHRAADAGDHSSSNGRAIPMHGPALSKHLRVGLLTALVAAAAVIVIASLPFQAFDSTPMAHHNQTSRGWPQEKSYAPAPMLVDYQRPVYQPQRVEGDVFRDVIGVQGDNPNVIIILERLTRQSRMNTVSGDI